MTTLFLSILLLFPIPSSQCPYHLRPLKLGVEVTGITLQDHVNDTALFDQIKSDVFAHRLLLFKNQGHIPADTLIAMFGRYGGAYRNPFSTQGDGFENHQKSPAPAIMRISNDPKEGYKGLGTLGWHIDGAYKPVPFGFLVFNSIKAPTIGSTKFAGHREIISSIKTSTLRKLDRLWTVVTRKVEGDRVDEVHPILYTHPVVNESVFCLHLGYTSGVIQDYGLTNENVFSLSRMLQLKGHLTHEIEKDDERLIYAHKWNEDDLIIIDNLQIMHLATKETQQPKEKIGLRILHRLSIHGIKRPQKTPEMMF